MWAWVFGKDFPELSASCLAELLADIVGYDDI